MRQKCDKNWQVEQIGKVDRLLFLDAQKVDLCFFRENAHYGIEYRRSINDNISMNIRDIVKNSKTIN